MSRIGKLPVNLPAGVSAEILPGNVVKVKGPLGELSQKVDVDITVTIEGNEIKLTRPTDQFGLLAGKRGRQRWFGCGRSRISDAVFSLAEGSAGNGAGADRHHLDVDLCQYSGA